MLYVVYIESIRAITIWDKKPDGDNLFEHLNCFRNEPLIYHIHPGEDNYDEWLDFFFPASKYGECLDSNIMRTISQETFDRFIAGEYDKVDNTVKRTITVVFEKKRGSVEWGPKEYTYYCEDPNVEVGDIIDSPGYNNRVKVIEIGTSCRTDLRVMPMGKTNPFAAQ